MKWRTKSAVSGRGPAPKNAPPPAREPKRVTYGGDQTIWDDGELNVEVDMDGNVVSVWFRCRALPFKQVHVSNKRASEMMTMYRRDSDWANMPIHSIVFEKEED